MTTTAPAPHAFTALDRCDRCGAQAFMRAVLSSGDLLFCAHHGRAHESALRDVASDIQDESHLLAETPAIAPDGER